MPTPASRQRRRPSLLYVTTVASTAEHFLSPFARELRGRGWRVDVATSVGESGPALDGVFDRVHDLPMSRSVRDLPNLVRAWRTMRRVVGSGFDIVHVHTPIAAMLARMAVATLPTAARPAVAYTAHGFHFHQGGHPVTNGLFLLAERWAGRWTDRMVVINAEDHEAARRHRIVRREQLTYMPGIGLDTEHFSRARVPPHEISSVRRSIGVAIHAPLFAFVGDMNRNKRPTDIVSALHIMRNRDAHVVFVGDGQRRHETLALAARLGVEARVHVTGFVADVRPYVAAAVGLILPSTREGLARSIMEALALEVPVIGSNARGNAEALGSAGFIYPTGDVPRLAEHMDWLSNHPGEGAKIGRRGRRWVVERFDIRHVVDLQMALYDDMVK